MSAVAELTSRQELVLDGLDEYYIDTGGHGENAYAEKTACIMESLCLVLGYKPGYLPDGDEAYLTPPCVSEQIAQFMVEVNDAILDDKHRAKLKPLAVMILNTAPTYKKGKLTYKKKSDADYKRAEKARENLLYKFFKVDDRDYGWSVTFDKIRSVLFSANGSFQYNKLRKFVQRLVDAGKFEGGGLVENV